MSSAKQPAPDPRINEELRTWLEAHIASHPHLSTAILARSSHIGVSRKALDAYLAGTYFVPVSEGGLGAEAMSLHFERSIRLYRERIEGMTRQGFQNTFVATAAWHEFQMACKIAENEKVIVIVYGPPGVGKSRCLQEYLMDALATVPVSVLVSPNDTPRTFVQKLAKELGIDKASAVAILEQNIADKLRRSGRPVFIDQANYLSEKGLGTVCYLWEVARVPVVLIGTPALYEKFTTSKETEEVRAQLSSRVAVYHRIGGLRIEEAKAILERGLGQDATDEVVRRIYDLTKGIHRHVDMVIPRILELKELNRKQLEDRRLTMIDVVGLASRKLLS